MEIIMEDSKLNIAFFGSGIIPAYWNGAVTHYRGTVKALHKTGHKVTFYEPDIINRQKRGNIEDPPLNYVSGLSKPPT